MVQLCTISLNKEHKKWCKGFVIISTLKCGKMMNPNVFIFSILKKSFRSSPYYWIFFRNTKRIKISHEKTTFYWRKTEESTKWCHEFIRSLKFNNLLQYWQTEDITSLIHLIIYFTWTWASLPNKLWAYSGVF